MTPRVFIPLGLLAVCLLLVGSASAFLAGYGYYQDVTLNNTGSNLTNYQVMFVVNTSSGTSSGTTLYLNSHSEADLDDLRFTDTSDNLYDYWIESTSNPYNVWVELPSIPTGNSTMRVQYGNAAAAAVSNGTETFPFFDDFPGSSIDTGKWNVYSGTTVSVSSGIASFSSTTANRGFYGKTTFGYGYALRVRWKSSGESDYIDVGFEVTGDNNHRAVINFATQKNYVTTSTSYGGTTHTNSYLDYATWEVRKIPGGAAVDFVYNDGSPVRRTTTLPTTDRPPGTNVYGGGGATKTGYYDWFAVRSYTATEPTAPAWSGESATTAAPVAAFSGTPTSGATPLTVAFTDASTNTPTSWAWSWDDGTANGTTQNPSHQFTSAGTYTIALTATNADGSDTETKVDYITVCDTPVAAFSGTPTSGATPLTVTFTDASTNTPTSWAWAWDDGTANGTTQNPSHQFTSAGTYNVTLTSTNCGGSDGETKVDYITVCDTPVAAFSANVTSGSNPLHVQFTDTSTGSPSSWAWSFDDGGANSTAQNPTRTFSVAGTYNITLTATNCGGSDGETKLAYITINPPLTKFPGCANYPTDLDADGLYEDINGNTRKDWSDIILFFNNLDWARVNQPAPAFDWNGNGIIDFADAYALYVEGV